MKKELRGSYIKSVENESFNPCSNGMKKEHGLDLSLHRRYLF